MLIYKPLAMDTLLRQKIIQTFELIPPKYIIYAQFDHKAAMNHYINKQTITYTNHQPLSYPIIDTQ